MKLKFKEISVNLIREQIAHQKKKERTFWVSSTHHRAAHLRAAQQVQVQMENGLTRMLACVEDSAIPFFTELELARDRLNGLEEILKDRSMFGFGRRNIRDMFLWNYENMDWGLGADIPESKNPIVLEDFPTRQGASDDFAKNTFTSAFLAVH